MFAQRVHAEPDLSTVNEPVTGYKKNLPRFKLSDGTEISLAMLSEMLATHTRQKARKKSAKSGKKKR